LLFLFSLKINTYLQITMEYDNNKMSNCSNSECSSFTIDHKKEITLKKIAKFKEKLQYLKILL
jgi:hypothetical protein